MASRKTAVKRAARRKRGRARGTVGGNFEDLVKLQARLLAPGGCPWDREQTHHTLRTYLLEETYEVLEAIEAGDSAKLREELGDLLLQIVFHAALAGQEKRFDIREVVRGVHDKMVRRHPHVFGNVDAATSGEVLKNWEQIKAEERRAGTQTTNARAQESLLDGVPRTLPAVLEAYQLTRRAARIGFDWEDLAGVLKKVGEEAAELEACAAGHSAASSGAQTGTGRVEEEVGDLLFAAVNVARFAGVDPEIALKKANRKFTARFRQMEQAMRLRGRRLADASREEMELLWEASKNNSPGRKARVAR